MQTLQSEFSQDAYVTTRMWANAQRDGRPAKYKVAPSVQRRKVLADVHY